MMIEEVDTDLLLKAGNDFLANREFDKAIECFDRILAHTPDHCDSLMLGGVAYNFQKNYIKALSYFRQALKQKPDSAGLYPWIARILREMGELEQAKSCLKQGLSRHSENTLMLESLAELHELLGERKEEIEVRTRMTEIEPDNAAYFFRLAHVHMEHHNLQDSIKCFERVIRLDNANAYSYCMLGILYASINDLFASNFNYNAAIAVQPDYFEAYYYQGINHFDVNRRMRPDTMYKKKDVLENFNVDMLLVNKTTETYDLTAAVWCYSKAFEVASSDIQKLSALHSIVLVYMECGDLHGQKQILETCLKINPSDCITLYNMARVFSRLSRFEEAEHCLQRIQAIDPNHLFLNHGYAFNASQQQNFDEALYYYQRQLEITPGHIETMVSLGHSYSEKGLYLQAYLWTRKAWEQDSDCPVTKRNLEYYCEKMVEYGLSVSWMTGALDKSEPDISYLEPALENPEILLAFYQELTERNPTDAVSHNNMGALYLQQSCYKNAEASFRKAIELQPELTDAYYNLAFACYLNKEYISAEQAFIKFMEKSELYGESSYIAKPFYERPFIQALIALCQKKPEKAIEILSELIRNYPDSGELYWFRGEAYRLNNNHDASEDDFDIAESINPDLGDASLNVVIGSLNKTDSTDFMKQILASEKVTNFDFYQAINSLKKSAEMID